MKLKNESCKDKDYLSRLKLLTMVALAYFLNLLKVCIEVYILLLLYPALFNWIRMKISDFGI